MGILTTSLYVGYLSEEDRYITYVDAYDQVTYSVRTILGANGEPVRRAGKTVGDLITEGAYVSDEVVEAIGGYPTPVPKGEVVEATATAVMTAPVTAATYTVKLVHSDFTVEYKNVQSVQILDASGKVTLSLA